MNPKAASPKLYFGNSKQIYVYDGQSNPTLIKTNITDFGVWVMDEEMLYYTVEGEQSPTSTFTIRGAPIGLNFSPSYDISVIKSSSPHDMKLIEVKAGSTSF